MTSAQQPGHLLTDRLDLRPIRLGDLDPVHRLLSDPGNFRHVPEGPKDSLEASRAWIEHYVARWADAGLSYWTVRLRGTGAVIGVGGAERRPKFWNLYYLLDRRCRGRGYATELALAAQREALALASELPITAWIHEQNAASQAVARRLGLTNYGELAPGHWDSGPMHCWADRQPVVVS